jgi:hypothetical protein
MLWRKKPFATCSFEKKKTSISPCHFHFAVQSEPCVRMDPRADVLGATVQRTALAAAQATKHKDILHAAAQLLSSQTLHGRKRRRGRPGATTGKRLSEFLLTKSGASDLDGLNRREAKLSKRWNMLEPLDQTRQVEVKVASLKPLTALSLGRWPELPSIFVANASCR